MAIVAGASACTPDAPTAPTPPPAGVTAPPVESSAPALPVAPDLTGVWDNAGAADTFSQEAAIAGSVITINWIPQDGSSDPMVYWIGTFDAPSSDGKHEWTSKRDREQTDNELMASSDDTKEFTYENGTISYEVEAMGEVRMLELTQTSTTSPSAAEPAGDESLEVLKSGFVASDGYAWVTAMVKHLGHTGEYATVLFNVYAGDKLIASEEQVELLASAGTTFPIGTQISVPEGKKPTRVEATVTVSDHGSSDEPLPVIEPFEALASDPGITVENTTDTDWNSPRIATVCWTKDGEIAGGGSDFPNAVAAGDQFLTEGRRVILGEGADKCEAYVMLQPE